MQKRIILGITGASGALYGIRALQILKDLDIESHLILSHAAAITISQETDWKAKDVRALAAKHYDPRDIAAGPASGSFECHGMLVSPCSIKTLSAIANSYASDLIARAADVTLKEGRPLVLMVRETPLHRGHLHLMDQAASAGAVIFPPVPAFYSQPRTIDDIVNSTVGRALKRLGIDNDSYIKWQGLNS